MDLINVKNIKKYLSFKKEGVFKIFIGKNIFIFSFEKIYSLPSKKWLLIISSKERKKHKSFHLKKDMIEYIMKECNVNNTKPAINIYDLMSDQLVAPSKVEQNNVKKLIDRDIYQIITFIISLYKRTKSYNRQGQTIKSIKGISIKDLEEIKNFLLENKIIGYTKDVIVKPSIISLNHLETAQSESMRLVKVITLNNKIVFSFVGTVALDKNNKLFNLDFIIKSNYKIKNGNRKVLFDTSLSSNIKLIDTIVKNKNITKKNTIYTYTFKLNSLNIEHVKRELYNMDILNKEDTYKYTIIDKETIRVTRVVLSTD